MGWCTEDFVEYFNEEWLFKSRNWFESAATLLPSTNNALEASNNVIKREHSFRNRFDLDCFKVVVFEKLSDEYELGLNFVSNFVDKSIYITGLN